MADFVEFNHGKEFYNLSQIVTVKADIDFYTVRTTDKQTHYLDITDGEWLCNFLSTRSYKRNPNGTSNS